MSRSRALWRWGHSVSIRVKIMGIVLGFTLLLGGAAMILVANVFSHQLREQLERTGVSTAKDLAAGSAELVPAGDIYRLHRLLADARENNPDIRYALTTNSRGRVLAHTFSDGFPRGLADAHPPAETVDTLPIPTDEGTILDIAAPVAGGRFGTVRVGMSQQALRDRVNRVTGQILLATLLVGAIGLLTAYFLTVYLTVPVEDLVSATEQVRRGDLTIRIPVRTGDELGLLSGRFNSMVEDLETAQETRARLVRQLVRAQEDERMRLARELHDETAQLLTSLVIGAKALEGEPLTEEARRQVDELREIASRTLEAVHNLAVDLRPSVLDELGLDKAVERYVEEFGKRTGIRADYVATGLTGVRLPAEIETAVYRIVQEALTNAAKHAEAHAVGVWLKRKERTLTATVEDDGKGFSPDDAKSGRLGLFGMEERAALIGAELQVQSEPGGGVTVRLRVPLAEETDGG